MLGAFEEDEAHAILGRVDTPRIEQLEVEPAQPKFVDGDQGSVTTLLPIDHH